MLTMRRSVQRALGENIEQPAPNAAERKKKAKGYKLFRKNSCPAKKRGGGT